MATKIDKDYIFEAGIHFEDSYSINVFEVTISLEVNTTYIDELDIAIERMNHFIYNIMQNSVLVSESKTEAIEKYQNAGLSVCILPDEPHDQVIASLIMVKINSILEKRLLVEDIVFASKNTGGVRFTILYEDLPKSFFKKSWWTTSEVNINTPSKDNVVNLFGNNDWGTLELSWKAKTT